MDNDFSGNPGERLIDNPSIKVSKPEGSEADDQNTSFKQT